MGPGSLRVGLKYKQIADFTLERAAGGFKGFEVKGLGAIPEPGR